MALYAVLVDGHVLEYPEGGAYPAWERDGSDGTPSDVAVVAQEIRSRATLEERTRPGPRPYDAYWARQLLYRKVPVGLYPFILRAVARVR